MGFELGRKYQCQDCLHIGPAVLEFETEEAYLAVMAVQENEWACIDDRLRDTILGQVNIVRRIQPPFD